MYYSWIVSQEGSRQTYAVPHAFQRIGGLRLLCTDVWCRRGRNWLLRGPKAMRAWATRYHPDIPSSQVVSFDSAAVLRLTGLKLRKRGISAHELGNFYISFGQWFANQVRRQMTKLEFDRERDCFFGFDTNCLETLEFLKDRGVFTVVDQVDPGQVEEDLVQEEAARWPGWEKVPGRMPEAYLQRRRAEWQLADVVLVNSEWSRDALARQGVASERIIVIPLATDLHHFSPESPVSPVGTLKVVWLGSLILRKGIQYLVEAARLLEHKDIEFLLAGPVGISPDAVKTFPRNMKLLGRITRDQLDDVYRQGHLFVLPTISDGFAITQLEAMAHGLPVVTTPNCGRVVTDGVDGLIVPARDSQALALALSRLNADRKLVTEMSRQALQTVKRFDLPSNALMINREVARIRDGRPASPENAAVSQLTEPIVAR